MYERGTNVEGLKKRRTESSGQKQPKGKVKPCTKRKKTLKRRPTKGGRDFSVFSSTSTYVDANQGGGKRKMKKPKT